MAVRQSVPKKPRPHSARRDSVTAVKPPPLASGDRLTRAEFERRYHAMPYVNKTELIEGVVYMPTPVRYASHGKPHQLINTWLGTYCAFTPGVETADNATVRLDLENEVQPDALLRLVVGGRSAISDDDYLAGAPELIVEVATSSAAYDLHDKLRVYRRNGVQEYVVWQVYDEQLDWLVWHEGEYLPLEPDETGVMRSLVFPGLWLAAPALLDGDLAGVLAELQNGLAASEHAALVERLTTS